MIPKEFRRSREESNQLATRLHSSTQSTINESLLSAKGLLEPECRVVVARLEEVHEWVLEGGERGPVVRVEVPAGVHQRVQLLGALDALWSWSAGSGEPLGAVGTGQWGAVGIRQALPVVHSVGHFRIAHSYTNTNTRTRIDGQGFSQVLNGV